MKDDTQTIGDDAPVTTDTADTQTSEADAQTNNQAPEASQDLKDSDVNATDTAEEKLYAGKYKDVETLENSYKELESKYGKEASEKAELTKILNEAFATPEATTVTDTASEDYAESPQVNPVLEQLQRDNAVVKFIMSHQEADGEAMKKILADDPNIKQVQGHEAKLEYAYLKSQNMSTPKAIEEAKKTAQAETQVKTAEKQAAQVESARKSEAVEESLLDRATGNHSYEDREAARRELIKKHLVNL